MKGLNNENWSPRAAGSTLVFVIAMRTTRALLLSIVALAIAGTLPHSAHAGTYTYSACQTPAGLPSFVVDWRFSAGYGSINHANSGCYKGGHEDLTMDAGVGHAARDYAQLEFNAPADTIIQSYTLWRSVQVGSWYNWRYYEKTASGTLVERDGCYGVRGCSSKGNTSNPLADANKVGASNRYDLTGLRLQLTCGKSDSGGEACPAQSPAANLRLYRADIVLRDDAAPVMSAPSGPLVDPTHPVTGAQPVTISATDRGGGVYQATLEVDGQRVQTTTLDGNGGRCVAPFRYALPCKLSASATVPFDTSGLADGPHQLRVLVSDAAGNEAAWGPVTITTANGSCNPEPRVKTLNLRAGTGSRLRGHVTTTYGRRVRIRGRLRGSDGKPLAGAQLCVAAHEDAAGRPLTPAGTVTTDAHGRFTYLVKRGPSRRFYFVRRVPGGAVSRNVLVRVRAPVSLRIHRHTLRTGDTLALHGRIRGGRIPPGGLLVLMEAPRDGQWQPFGSIRTNAKGRFTFRYTFTRTRGVQSYRLRARVPSQTGYPFAAGAAHAVRVRVTG